ncbi:MAG: hypothetical protein AAGI17_01185 [Planctomycetota bacterium]
MGMIASGSRMTARAGRMLAVLALAVVSGLAAPQAAAQNTMSPAELRRELEQERVRAERAEQRVAQLEAELQALRAELAAMRQGGTPQRVRPAGVAPSGGSSGQAPVPGDPLASPSSLFFAMQLSYEQATSFDGRPEPSERDVLNAVRDWTRDARRELSGLSEWLVQLRAAEMTEGTNLPAFAEASMTVLDRRSLRPIGSPIRVQVPGRFRSRVSEAGEHAYFLLDARVQAAPVFNANREEAGIFNFPLLIGPYAEFGFDLDWQRLRPIDEDEARQGGTGTQTPAQPGR